MSDRKDAWFQLLSRWTQRRRRKSLGKNLVSERRQFESLEGRRLLALTDATPSVQGTVFVDDNEDGQLTAGEELAGVTVQLFTDDGDGVFETNGDDVQLGADVVSDVDGDYVFDAVDGTDSYFLVQPAQTVSGLALSQQVSSLLSPGTPNLVIDAFTTAQEARAIPPAPDADGSTLAFANESEVIGAERDLQVELTSGVGEVSLIVNPFNSLPVLQFNSASGVQGSAVVTWDGQDFSSAPTPSMGLGGVDLTQGGINTGIGMQLGIDQAGAGETLTLSIFQGNAANVSTVTTPIPVTDGTASAYLFIPFTDFSGPVSASNVDAIQLSIGDQGIPSADGQVDIVGAIGPTIFNLQNPRATDLQITKTNATQNVVPGESISYSITVQNNGPVDVVGAVVQDNFPAEITTPSYTSTTTGTVSGNTPSGNGSINDVIDITTGSSVTYTVTGTVAPGVTGDIVNTATVTMPDGGTELDLDNNEDQETDTATPEVDLAITKTDGVTEVAPGDTVTYTITVTNAGPSDVVGATITDTFPVDLTNISYTSTTANGTVTGNTASGNGNISDIVNMVAGSTITYTVTATVDDAAEGQISNTASVAPPTGTTERNSANNNAIDIDTVLDQVDLTISKTDNTTTAVPGETITYQIVVQNAGPRTATDAVVQDTFPTTLTNVSWTSTASGGATGNDTNQTGNINDTVTLPSGSSITYTVTATVEASATGQLTNTATVTAPQSVVETDNTNNTATDTDTLVPTVDLVVTKTDNVTSVEPNDTLTYEIVVTNNGPSDVVGAQLSDSFPAELTSISYTSTAAGGASGNTTSGTGSLTETLDMPAGSTVTYTVSATVLESATSNIANTVTVTAPNGTTETNTANNTANDIDTLVPGVDLSITKTNNSSQISAGGTTTYTIVVSNTGPNPVTGATVVDTFDARLENVTYTSTATGGASGNTNGSSSINDTVNLPVGSSITYTVVASVRRDATGQLSNVATVTVPNSTVEIDTTNNSSTDTDTIDMLLAQISGFVYVDLDGDGQRDANEAGIPGVEILLEQNGNQIDSTNTDASGAYLFDDLQPGTYDVVETQPAVYNDGEESVDGVIGEILANDRFRASVIAGDQATGLNFGELSPQPTKRSLLTTAFRNL